MSCPNDPNDTAFEDAIDQLCFSHLGELGPDCHDAERIDMIMT